MFVEAEEEDTLDCASEKGLEEEGVLDVVGMDLEGDLSNLQGEVLDASKGAVETLRPLRVYGTRECGSVAHASWATARHRVIRHRVTHHHILSFSACTSFPTRPT